MSELLVVHASGTTNTSELATPGFLCSEFEKPDKKEAIKEKQTRFMQ